MRYLTALFVAFSSFMLPAPTTSVADAQAQPVCRLFAETGKRVCGAFLVYWDEHGGLRQQGLPLSEEMRELSDADGKSYTVQYFERAVFELHVENAPPYNVLLSRLGSFRYRQKYPNGAQELPPPMSPVAGRFFPETGKEVRGAFLDYWRQNGGLAQQGFPISNPFMEKSDLDGQTYMVQYFERAVFEMHPENQPPYNVLLSQLGTFQYKKKYPNGSDMTKKVAAGEWGGTGIALLVSDTGTQIEYDCASGKIEGPLLTDANGRFTARGTHTFERGGPIRVEDPPDTHPALYTGLTDGKTMTLTVTLTDANRAPSTYKVEFGKVGRVVKCL